MLARTVSLDYSQAGVEWPLAASRSAHCGHDGSATQPRPPLEFGYTTFTPEARRYQPLTAQGKVPPASLGAADIELADLFGDGLPCVLDMNGQARYWRNQGEGAFALPRSMTPHPASGWPNPAFS